MTEPKRLTQEELAEALQRSRQWMHDGFRHHLTSIEAHIAALEAELHERNAELKAIDMILGNRIALDGLDNRYDKILLALRIAQEKDPLGVQAANETKVLKLEAELAAKDCQITALKQVVSDREESCAKLAIEMKAQDEQLAAKEGEKSRRLATSATHHCPSCGGWHEYVKVCPNNGCDIDWSAEP